MAFIFPYIGDVIIPTDALHHFSEGWLNHQVSLECHANEIHIDHAINNNQMTPSLSPGTLSFSIGNRETFLENKPRRDFSTAGFNQGDVP